jgi:hypothetical protein
LADRGLNLAAGGVEFVKFAVQDADGAVAFAQRGFEVGDLGVFGRQAARSAATMLVSVFGGGAGSSVTAATGRWARMSATRSSRR